MSLGQWVKLSDEWDLKVIAESGQCFRMTERENPGFADAPERLWRVITGRHVLYMAQEENRAWVSADTEEWEEIWLPYFDASMDYAAFRKKGMEAIKGGINTGKNGTGSTGIGNIDPACYAFVEKALASARGLRILRQDPFEMLLTFMISQRKSIPAIAGNVEALCRDYGEELLTPVERVHAFPAPEALASVGEEDYRKMGMGYRSPYLADAVQRVLSGELCLPALSELPTQELIQELMRVKGVGIKVASCVALFGYGRKDSAPVDVWIARAIREDFGGIDPFPAFAPFQGLFQQYVFYYQKHRG